MFLFYSDVYVGFFFGVFHDSFWSRKNVSIINFEVGSGSEFDFLGIFRL